MFETVLPKAVFGPFLKRVKYKNWIQIRSGKFCRGHYSDDLKSLRFQLRFLWHFHLTSLEYVNVFFFERGFVFWFRDVWEGGLGEELGKGWGGVGAGVGEGLGRGLGRSWGRVGEGLDF